MYQIISADGREYGPLTAEQIRAWATEDRIRPETMVKMESDQHWKPVATLAEFADLWPSKKQVGTPPHIRLVADDSLVWTMACFPLLWGLFLIFVFGFSDWSGEWLRHHFDQPKLDIGSDAIGWFKLLGGVLFICLGGYGLSKIQSEMEKADLRRLKHDGFNTAPLDDGHYTLFKRARVVCGGNGYAVFQRVTSILIILLFVLIFFRKELVDWFLAVK